MGKPRRSLSPLFDQDQQSYEFKFTRQSRALFSAAEFFSPPRGDPIHTNARMRVQDSNSLAVAYQAKLYGSEFASPGA